MALQKPTYISLPARNSISHSESSDNYPSTPLPGTPLPLLQPLAPTTSTNSLSDRAGSKRSRITEDESDYDWTEEDLDIIQSTLANPYRPIKAFYPPGDLPPPDAIDEFVNQIIAFNHDWPHSWSATRSRVFDAALKISKFGPDVGSSTQVTGSRPGLRRVDSMDFLESTEPGRAICLSTSLQNSAKLDSKPLLTVTPASPRASSSRQRGRTSTRTTRPSLLQRGRSFTADDLVALAELPEEEVPAVAKRSLPTVAVPKITRSQSSSTLVPSHPARDTFMTHQPSTKDRSTLAKALPSVSNSGWSDSDDEAVGSRLVKKGRLSQSQRASLNLGGALQSPFEEKEGFRY